MKTVLITGANRGIGFSLVERYLSLGWQVHATYRSESSSQSLLNLQNDNLICHQLDVTDYECVSKFSDDLPALDLLINNAGYYGPKGYGFGNTDIDEWRKSFRNQHHCSLKIGRVSNSQTSPRQA